VSLLYGQYNSVAKNDNNLTIAQSMPFPTVFMKQSGLNKAMIHSAKLKETVARNELTFSVRQAFNQLLYLKERDQLLLQQDSLLRDLVKVASLHYKTGEGTLLEKTSAETHLLEMQNQRSRNTADIQIALAQLRLLCQLPEITDVNGTLAELSVSMNADSILISNNPLLALSKQQVQVNEWQHKKEIANTLPDLRFGYFNQTLIGTQNINGQDQYFGTSDRFQGFQVGVGIPLWIPSHTARVKAASLATEEAQKQDESVSLAVNQHYNQAMQELEKNKSSLHYYNESALKTATLLTAQSKLAFKSGEIDYTTLLLNLKQALVIREGYLHALHQYTQSLITLHYLNGN
jgi:cobalt-zinc-cadmium resistance protein CzcA